MKLFLILLLLSFMVFSCHNRGQKFAETSTREEDNINKGELLNHNFYYSTSYENTADSAIIIEVVINNKKRRFLLDTGAPLSISKSIQEECHFPVFQKSTLYDSNGDSSTIEIVSVDNLKLGNIGFQGIPALIFDMEAFPFECEKLDGIIGSNLLRLLVVQFDKRKNQVVFTDQLDRLHINPRDESHLYLSKEQSDPRITVVTTLNGVDTCTFDTGDKSFYIISSSRMEKSNTINSRPAQVIAEGMGLGSMGIVGKTQLNKPSWLVGFDTLSISNHPFSNVIAAPTNAARSRVGRGLLKYGVVTLDYPGQRFYFSPFRELHYDSLKSFGINYLEHQGKLIIATVWKNSRADQLGLKPGLEIVQFGQFKPSARSVCDWRVELQKETSGNQLILVYLDEKGMQKEAVLPAEYFK